MASPYALDFSPIAQAIQNKQQNDLAWAQNALAEKRLGFEGERLGFERELQPIKLQGARQDVAQAAAMNPLHVRELTSKLNDQDQLFPFTLRQAKTATETGEENQAITRQYREEQGFAVPNSAARLPTAGGATAPQAQPTSRSSSARSAADTVENYVLNVPDAGAAQSNWKQFQAHPEIGPKYQQHVQAYGSTGDWKRDASDFVRDMRHEANGNVLKPWQSVPGTALSGGSAGGSLPSAPTATTQQSPVLPPSPSGPAASVSIPADGNKPLFPSIGGAMKATERMAAVPGMASAAEAKLKILNTMIDKGIMPTAPGSQEQVMSMSGFPAAEGAKKQAESLGTHTGQNQAGVIEARRRADISMGLLDQLEELAKTAYLKDPELLKAATGPYASKESVQAALQAGRQVPLLGRGVPGSEESFNLNKRMHHIIEGLSTQIKIAAARGVVTDQAQRTFDSAIGKFMETDDPNTFFAIMHDARNIIKGMGGQMPEPIRADYIPKASSSKGAATTPQTGRSAAAASVTQLPADQHARAITEARQAVEMQGKPLAAVRQRLIDLGVDPAEAGL